MAKNSYHVEIQFPAYSTPSLPVCEFNLTNAAFNQCYSIQLRTKPLLVNEGLGYGARIVITHPQHRPRYYHGVVTHIIKHADYWDWRLRSPLIKTAWQQRNRHWTATDVETMLTAALVDSGLVANVDFQWLLSKRYAVPTWCQINTSDYALLQQCVKRFSLVFMWVQHAARCCLLISDRIETLMQECKQIYAEQKCVGTFDSYHQHSQHLVFSSSNVVWQLGDRVDEHDPWYTVSYLIRSANCHVDGDGYLSLFQQCTAARNYNLPHDHSQIADNTLPLCAATVYNPVLDPSAVTNDGRQKVHFEHSITPRDDAHSSEHLPRMTWSANHHGGWQFPLEHGTTVLCAALNNDPMAWFIIGVLPTAREPALLQHESAANFGWRSRQNCQWWWYAGNESYWHCQTPRQQMALLTVNHQPLTQWVSKEGVMRLHAGQQISMQAAEWILHANDQMQVNAKRRISMSTHRGDIWLRAPRLRFDTTQHWRSVGQHRTQIRANNLQVTCARTQIKAAEIQLATQRLTLSIQKSLRVQSNGAIRIGNDKCFILCEPSGKIILQARTICMRSAAIIAATVAPSATMATANVPTITLADIAQLQNKPWQGYRLLKLEKHHTGFTDQLSQDICFQLNQHLGGSTDLPLNQVTFELSPGHFQQTTDDDGLAHIKQRPSAFSQFRSQGFEWWQCNHQQQPPHPNVTLPTLKHTATESVHLRALWPMMIYNLRQPFATLQAQFKKDLQYFKHRGNTVTLFIHGFNVSEGRFSKHFETINPHHGYEVVYHATDASIVRDFSQLHHQFPDISLNDHRLLHLLADERLNGSGDKNWFLHIENNFNRANGFSGHDYGEYQRLMHISWPGDPEPYNYMTAVSRAAHSAEQLAELLKLCIAEGLTIQLVAHSLGNCVCLHALELIAQAQLIEKISCAVLWQAAVPDTVFDAPQTDFAGDEQFHFPHLAQAAKRFIVLHSRHDNILGPRDWHVETQRFADRYKVDHHALLSMGTQFMGWDSIYSLAMTFGVPLSYLVSSHDARRQYYQRWVEHFPKSKAGKPFAATLELATRELPTATFHPMWCFLSSDLLGLKSNNSLCGREAAELLALNNVVKQSPYRAAPALGWSGPALSPVTQQLMNSGKLISIDQQTVLFDHCGMKEPSARLLHEVYRDVILADPHFHFGSNFE